MRSARLAHGLVMFHTLSLANICLYPNLLIQWLPVMSQATPAFKSPLSDFSGVMDFIGGGRIRRLIQAEKLLGHPSLTAWRLKLAGNRQGCLAALTHNIQAWKCLKAILLQCIMAWLIALVSSQPKPSTIQLTPKLPKPIQARPDVRPGAPAHL